jgi:hypothetical protein
MIAVTKKMIVVSALASAAIVGSYVAVQASLGQPTAAASIASRFPTQSEMFVSTPKPAQTTPSVQAPTFRKGNKLAMSGDCAGQEWPYISAECLVSKDGQPVRPIARVITVERRIDTASSELIRMPVTSIAQR